MCCGLKICISLQRNHHFGHPDFQENMDFFPFFEDRACGHHVFHSTPQGLALRLHIQPRTYFNIWRCVATCSCTPIWTSLGLLLTALSVEGFEVTTFWNDARWNPFVGFPRWFVCKLLPTDFWTCIASWRHSFGGSPGPFWNSCSQSLFCNWLEIHEHHLHIPRILLAPTSTSWPGSLLAWILAEVEPSWPKRHSGLRQFSLLLKTAKLMFFPGLWT